VYYVIFRSAQGVILSIVLFVYSVFFLGAYRVTSNLSDLATTYIDYIDT